MGKLKNTATIYLDFGNRMKIPVNPEEIEIKYPSNNKEYEVLGVGQIVVPRKPGLKEVPGRASSRRPVPTLMSTAGQMIRRNMWSKSRRQWKKSRRGG